MTDVTPFLWFDDSAEAAIDFYTALIPGSELVSIGRYPDEVPGMGGKVMHAHFRLAGRDYYAMDAGPQFPFTEAVSLFVSCADQAEVDRYWDALIAGGGEPSVCGWLKDRFGVSWQVVPRQLPEMLQSPDREAAGRAMEAMLKMTKIEVKDLEEAFNAVPAGR